MKNNHHDYSNEDSFPEVFLRVNFLKERLISDYIPDKNFLEIGIGSGIVTKMLVENFNNIVCIDPDYRVIGNVRKSIEDISINKNVEFINKTIEESDINVKFDYIIVQNIFEHLKDPIVVLKKLRNNLSDYGKIIISVPLANSFHRYLGVFKGSLKNVTNLSDTDIEYGHYRVYTLDLLRHHIASSGLKILFEFPFYLKPLQTKNLLKLDLDSHKKLFLLGNKFPEYASYIYCEVGK